MIRDEQLIRVIAAQVGVAAVVCQSRNDYISEDEMSETKNNNEVNDLLAEAEQSDDLLRPQRIHEQLAEIGALNAAAFVAGKIARLERKYAEEVWR